MDVRRSQGSSTGHLRLEPINQVEIEGVRTQLISSLLGDRGYLTEIYRRDWHLDDAPVDQVFQKVMAPGDLSAWHAHKHTLDRLFCAYGRVKVVLFDGREGSPTHVWPASPRLASAPAGLPAFRQLHPPPAPCARPAPAHGIAGLCGRAETGGPAGAVRCAAAGRQDRFPGGRHGMVPPGTRLVGAISPQKVMEGASDQRRLGILLSSMAVSQAAQPVAPNDIRMPAAEGC